MKISTIGRLRYLDLAPAPQVRQRGTLVLIHAFPLNARMWEPQFSLTNRGWRILAPQLRGFDGGDRSGAAQSMDDYAGDVIDLLDALHVTDAVIGGLSLGGYVAFAMFRHSPDYFHGMILADTRPQADTPEGIEGRRTMLRQVGEDGPAAVAETMMPKLLSEETRQHHPEVVERVRSLMLASSAEAIAGAIVAMMGRQDSTPLLQSIRCPTLIVVGELDQVTPPQVSEAMHKAIAGSELVVLPRAGHLANIDQSDAFTDAVGQFLDRRL